MIAEHRNDGRFKVGNPGGPGRPKKQREEEYLRILSEVMSPERMGEIIKELLTEDGWRAKAFAIELALHYGLGKPVQRVHQTGNGLADVLAMLQEKGE